MIMFEFTSSRFIFSRVSSFSAITLFAYFCRRLSFVIAYASRVAFRLPRLSCVGFRLSCDLGLFNLYSSCLEVSCVSSIILHACSLGRCSLFSLFFVWGMFLVFPLCAVRRVGTCWYLCSFVVLRPCSRLASFVARSWQEGGDIYVLRNGCQ